MPVHHIETIDSVYQYINAETLMIFDLDNTILEPDNPVHLGSDQWFRNLLEQGKHVLSDEKEVLRQAIIIRNAVHQRLNFRAIEAGTVPLINSILQHYHPFIVMTSRGPSIRSITEIQLHHVGLELIVNRNAIVYGNGKSKGILFNELGNIIPHNIKSIVMVDDDINHLISVKNACHPNFNFIGLRYGYLDKKIGDFKQLIPACSLELLNMCKLFGDSACSALRLFGACG